MKPVKFHPEAESEMIQAAVWYEEQQADLGKRFLTSIQDALNRIAITPQLYPVVDGIARRCLTKTFPFGIIFQVETDCLRIIAVMHLHREPNCWADRSSE
jgi:toxin ParE1/3/4